MFSDIFYLRLFWWSKGGVENRDGGGGEGKRFLNCQICRILDDDFMSFLKADFCLISGLIFYKTKI